MARPSSKSVEIHIPELKQGVVRLRIVGTTPMFQHRMAAKAKQQLLIGGQKKTAADRASLKHNPLDEYRDCMERMDDGPTAIGLRVVAMKAAMCTAALETAGITKTSAQRLIFMPGELVPLYGVPCLRMDMVRSSDIGRTPDVRTRPFIRRWGAEFAIHYVTPQLSLTSIITLACNAGVLVGLGDFRQEKGKGSFGSFRVIGPDAKDAEWDALVKSGGREQQLAAIENPDFADEDTVELMEYFTAEQKRRAA